MHDAEVADVFPVGGLLELVGPGLEVREGFVEVEDLAGLVKLLGGDDAGGDVALSVVLREGEKQSQSLRLYRSTSCGAVARLECRVISRRTARPT